MKINKNIVFAFILFAATLFCFEAYTPVHCNTPILNIENTTNPSNGEEKCNSYTEYLDDFRLNTHFGFPNFESIEYTVSKCSTPLFTYIVSFWQPPKIS